MLTARLFAAFASLFVMVALLGRNRLLPSTGLYLHFTYVAISPYQWQLLGALVCAIFALISFAVAQRMVRPLNEPMGLVSFAFIALALIILLIVDMFIGRAQLNRSWEIALFFGAIFVFMFGCVLFAVNVAWTIFHMFQTGSTLPLNPRQ